MPPTTTKDQRSEQPVPGHPGWTYTPVPSGGVRLWQHGPRGRAERGWHLNLDVAVESIPTGPDGCKVSISPSSTRPFPAYEVRVNGRWWGECHDRRHALTLAELLRSDGVESWGENPEDWR